jgi:hypothetical protein
MKKRLFWISAILFLMASLLYVPKEAEAVPAFARQTGLACNTCHFQHYPSLTAFGRAFKAGGFTMVGGQSLIEGDLLSLPSTLNASLVTKIRYQKRNGDADTSDNKGELQFPDEAALLIGGRIGEHVGFLLEGQLADPDSPAFASFKMPFVFDVADMKASVIPFSTDAGGASYGFELLNTGAIRMSRPIEHRSEMSAQQYIGTAGAATGFSFVASHNMGFANYTTFYPEHGTAAAGPLMSYIRLAATPTVGAWDVGAGIQWWTGTADVFGVGETKADAFAIDAQAQGMVSKYPLGVYASYGSAGKTNSGEPENTFNSSTFDDKDAFAIAAELGVLPNRVTVALAYRMGHTGEDSDNDGSNDTDDAVTFGVNYTAIQNVNVQLNHSIYSGDATSDAEGDQLTTLMLFSAF